MNRAVFMLAATLCASVALVFGSSVASGGTFNCTGAAPATVNGNLSAGPGCTLSGTHVTGNVSVTPTGSLTANGATIDGNVEIQNNSGTNSICGTTIGGNLQVHNNTGSTTIGHHCGAVTVGGNVEIHNNSGQNTISNTTTHGNLDCHNNSPATSLGSGGNTAGGNTSGECGTTSKTVRCKASGCSLTVSNGNTSVTVTVPGGGSSGNLTVTLSPPPANDGCNEEGNPDPSGSLVTVNPPGGYGGSTPDNSILVDITYNVNDSLSQICKSATGNPPFTPVLSCDETEGTAPCWQAGDGVNANDEPNEALVYITSTDPAIAGHT